MLPKVCHGFLGTLRGFKKTHLFLERRGGLACVFGWALQEALGLGWLVKFCACLVKQLGGAFFLRAWSLTEDLQGH